MIENKPLSAHDRIIGHMPFAGAGEFTQRFRRSSAIPKGSTHKTHQ
jgi:hypothetical protein